MTFENGLKAEMAPTDHAAVLRFTYPGDDASVVFDNVTDAGGLTLDPDDRRRHRLLGREARPVDRRHPALRLRRLRRRSRGGDRAAASQRTSRATCGFDAGADRTVTLRLATSLISVDQAKENLRQEIPDGTSFEHGQGRGAQRQWDRLLGKVEVEGATPDQLTTLYSSLYRLYLYPNSGFEKVGSTVPVRLARSPRCRVRTPRPTPARRSSTARCTSTTASGTPTGRPGRRTRS